MNIGACVGLKETLAANRLSSDNNDRYPLNQFVGKNFFDGENYRAALERLDAGYGVAIDVIELMKDYRDTEREQARNLVAYADKWTTRLKQQSTLVSYHTTKRAQLDVVRVTKELAREKESTCQEIQDVIEKYRYHVDETYISERFRPGRKHRRTNELKKLFKTAHASLREVSDELETLRAQEKKAQAALRTAEGACEILELDPTTTEKQLARANDNQTKKRATLADIEEKILETKGKHKVAQKIYRTKATDIFKQCQSAEEERLEQIRETLLDFIQAMCTEKYPSNLIQIFENLSMKITQQQNSFDDLLFWAKTYGIENKLTKGLPLTTTDDDKDEEEDSIESRLTKKSTSHETDKNDKYQSIPENELDNDEPSAALSTTILAKTKVKRTRNTIAIDTKKINHTEPSTTNHGVLNHV